MWYHSFKRREKKLTVEIYPWKCLRKFCMLDDSSVGKMRCICVGKTCIFVDLKT